MKPTRRSLERRIRLSPWKSKSQAKALRANLTLYAKEIAPRLKPHPLAPPGQAFDSYYLRESRLFRRSRELFLGQDGVLEPRLVTSPRSLSSTILLENRIQYSPTEDELLWHATDPGERSNDDGLLRLVGYSTSLFHEQSHRILWKLLAPPSALDVDSVRRYLNFIESLVIALDMALGDGLGPKRSAFGYLSGTLYDPGSWARHPSKRARRNYLQVAIRATFLALEHYSDTKVRKALPVWMPECDRPAADHAIERALRLDPNFIYVTNPGWQEKNLGTVRAFLAKQARGRKDRLDIPPDPEVWIAPYLAAEKVFDAFGL
jgi:hypothetical protein